MTLPPSSRALTVPRAVAACIAPDGGPDLADRAAELLEVWGVRDLYVADANVFPTSSGVNPMLTVMGIAHRAAGVIGTRL